MLSRHRIAARTATLTRLGLPSIIFLAVSLRLALLLERWPTPSADESIIDLMARHIAYSGAHPIFMWGQDYMGTIQAYLGAMMIAIFGSSVLSVRLGLLLIFSLYLVCFYLLVRLLFTPAYALFIIALLSLGSDRVLSASLVADGRYPETLLFAAAIFFLASWLGMTRPLHATQVSRTRLLAYAGLGVIAGLAVWSDELILPAILTAGAFLLLCCRGELRGRALGVLLLGFVFGATPLILYNVSAAPGQNSLAILLGTVFVGAPKILPLWQVLAHVLLISLPVATGMPFTAGIHATCGNVEPYAQPSSGLAAIFPSSNPWLCIGTRGAWSVGILLLWGIAVVAILRTIRGSRDERQDGGSRDLDAQAAWVRRTRLLARLMLLVSGALWLALFAVSAAAQYTPRASSRYLTCLLLTTPALLWIIWQHAGRVRVRLWPGQRQHGDGARIRLNALASIMILSAIAGLYLVGTGDVFANLPAAQNSYNRTSRLIQTLLDRGATHVYSDYATCSRLMFQSGERVVCGVLDEQLRPGYNRYRPYLLQVSAAPHPAYLFPISSAPARALTLRLKRNAHYHKMQFAGYAIYYVAPSPAKSGASAATGVLACDPPASTEHCGRGAGPVSRGAVAWPIGSAGHPLAARSAHAIPLCHPAWAWVGWFAPRSRQWRSTMARRGLLRAR
jgi:hypothetical protein